ncbi:MAG: hypothetical protein AAGB00_07370 [Planctomycetota bacterium]
MPAALGVRPAGKGHAEQVFIVEAGSGRVLVVEPAAPAPKLAEVTQIELPEGSQRLCAALLDERTLIVGFGEALRSGRGLRVMRLLDNPSGVTASVRQKSVSELLPGSVEDTLGYYAGLAVNGRYAFTAFRGARGGGRVLRARHTSGIVSAFRPLTTTEEFPSAMRLLAIAASERGYVAAVAEGEGGPRLLFADPDPQRGSGAPVAMPLNLPGVVAIAYSPVPRPAERRLYALANGDSTGGLFRIDAGLDASGGAVARATRIADLPRATAMAFGGGGVLYIAVEGDAPAKGKLLMLSNDF